MSLPFSSTHSKACNNLGIKGVDLYGGTKHSTATALSEFLTPEEIKRGGTGSTAGVAALWLSYHKRDKLIKQFDPDTKLQFVFKNLLKINARRPNGWDANKYGAGIVNAEKLLNANPDSVRKDSVDDYSDFKKRKAITAEGNLKAVEQMYHEIYLSNS